MLADLENPSPSRELLVRAIRENIPATGHSSILEIGAASGVNLIQIQRQIPNVTLRGIDISAYAVRRGLDFISHNGLKNILLETGKAENIKHGDGAFDLVFTDATLICLGPDKIRQAVSEALRVARKSVVFIEWHGRTGYRDHWVHDYQKLLKPYRLKQVRFQKIPKSIWGGDWGKYGYVIECAK